MAVNRIPNVTHLLVELKPSGVSLAVDVLETEKPDLSQADGLHDLIEQHLAGRVRLNVELEFRIHRGDANVDFLRHFGCTVGVVRMKWAAVASDGRLGDSESDFGHCESLLWSLFELAHKTRDDSVVVEGEALQAVAAR